MIVWSLTCLIVYKVPITCTSVTSLNLLIYFYITDRSKAILLWWFFLFYVLVFKNVSVLLAPYVCFYIFN